MRRQMANPQIAVVTSELPPAAGLRPSRQLPEVCFARFGELTGDRQRAGRSPRRPAPTSIRSSTRSDGGSASNSPTKTMNTIAPRTIADRRRRRIQIRNSNGAPWRSGCSCRHTASATCPTGVSVTITAAARTTASHQRRPPPPSGEGDGAEDDRQDDGRHELAATPTERVDDRVDEAADLEDRQPVGDHRGHDRAAG